MTTLSIHKWQDIHAPGGIRTCDPSKRVAADPLLRPRGRWDRRSPYTVDRKCIFSNGCSSDQVLLFNNRVWNSSRESLQSRSVVEQSPFWEAGSRSAVQEVPLSLEPSTRTFRKPVDSTHHHTQPTKISLNCRFGFRRSEISLSGRILFVILNYGHAITKLSCI